MKQFPKQKRLQVTLIPRCLQTADPGIVSVFCSVSLFGLHHDVMWRPSGMCASRRLQICTVKHARARGQYASLSTQFV